MYEVGIFFTSPISAGSALISPVELEVVDVADFIRKTNWMLKTKSFKGLWTTRATIANQRLRSTDLTARTYL